MFVRNLDTWTSHDQVQSHLEPIYELCLVAHCAQNKYKITLVFLYSLYKTKHKTGSVKEGKEYAPAVGEQPLWLQIPGQRPGEEPGERTGDHRVGRYRNRVTDPVTTGSRQAELVPGL